jgi:hypothetical protein
MNQQQFDHAFIKLWFVGSSISRNFTDIMTMQRNNDVLKLYQYDGTTYIVNWNNVTLIEEVHA